MKLKVYIKYGWDKTYYRTFNTLKKCETWLTKMSANYLPSQIISTWIIKVTK